MPDYDWTTTLGNTHEILDRVPLDEHGQPYLVSGGYFAGATVACTLRHHPDGAEETGAANIDNANADGLYHLQFAPSATIPSQSGLYELQWLVTHADSRTSSWPKPDPLKAWIAPPV